MKVIVKAIQDLVRIYLLRPVQDLTAKESIAAGNPIPIAVLEVLPTTLAAQPIVTTAAASEIIVMAKPKHGDIWVADNLPEYVLYLTRLHCTGRWKLAKGNIHGRQSPRQTSYRRQ